MPLLNGHIGLSITRRKFLRSSALTAAAIPAVSSSVLAAAGADTSSQHASQYAFGSNANFLESAQSAAQWIESAQRQDARGVFWLPEPDHPEKTTTVGLGFETRESTIQ